jgi:hypothetical protein
VGRFLPGRANIKDVPIDIERQIITVLQGMQVSGKPATFAYLARQFGVSKEMIELHAKHLISQGRAEPSMVTIRGVETLHGLLPQTSAPTS